MSKEEFLKIQTCVLEVNIHCDGCKHKVKKILQKIDGVYTIKIDSEQGKVTVSGNIDPATLIKKLIKNGKHAEIWGASKAKNGQQNQLHNQLKNLHIDAGKGGNGKGHGGKGCAIQPPKGGPQMPNPQLQQLQQLQQMKALQDMKLPPQFMKDMKLPAAASKDHNQKSVKFDSLDDEDLSDDYDDDDDDSEYDDDDYDDDDDSEYDDDPRKNKMGPLVGKGHGGGGGGGHSHLMKGVGNNGGNGQKNGGGNDGKGGANSGKKGGNANNNGANQTHNGKGGKNGGGQPHVPKNGGGTPNGKNASGNGGNKGVGMSSNLPHNMANMMGMGGSSGNAGHMGKSMPMGQMGSLPMGQMSNLAAVQGLPASSMNGAGAGYFPNAAPEQMAGNNPYYQQQLAAMMMNQQRANGNERFQPMMYARPPPAVNYMPAPYPPYPYPPPPGERLDQYSMFSDENASGCSVM